MQRVVLLAPPALKKLLQHDKQEKMKDFHFAF